VKSVWSAYDNSIFEILPEYGEQWMKAAEAILSGTGRSRIDIERFADYIRKNKKRFLDQYEGVRDHAEVLDIDLSDVKDGWLKHKKGSFRFINRDFVDPKQAEIKEIDFLSIFAGKIDPVVVTKVSDNCDGFFDRLVYTDVHIGMDVNKDGYSLYGGKWDEQELNRRLETMVNKVIANQKANVLYIDDLGDLMDGYDGQTVRQGHSLPQNMDNQKAFDVGLKFKIRMIDALVNHYDRIVCHNITDDNHGGSFTYIVNSAFKVYVEMKYPGVVEVVNQRKFIDHYNVGKYVFILTHGKDGKNLKHGFKPILDKTQESRIISYIKANDLLKKEYVVEFSKGDSHQLIFDWSTSRWFRYCNYPAFSPPSNWVQTNFEDSISGFMFFNYHEHTDKSINEHLF